MTTPPDRTDKAPHLAPLGTSGPRPPGQALAVIQHWLGPLDGKKVLDVGCGGGQLAQRLARDGADVIGIDPLETAIAIARDTVPEALFEVARAEALPFDDESFDAIVFHNSLHHVPGPAMAEALKEAMRVGRGPLLVIEPLAQGPFFETMRLVEDESAIRAAAQETIAAALSRGALRLLRSGEYDDPRTFPDLDAFLARVIAVDPARAGQIDTVRAEVAALFTRWGVPVAGGLYRFDQPHRAHLLSR